MQYTAKPKEDIPEYDPNDSILPKTEEITIEELAKEIKISLHDKFDFVLVVCGDRVGVGKSTFAMRLGYNLDTNFNLRDNVAYLPDAEEINQKFEKINKYGCLILDEAIKSLYKLNWQEKMQKLINESYMTNRKGHFKCTILCIPNWQSLNKFFRNEKIELIVYIPVRGLAILYRKIRSVWVEDPWFVMENFKRELKATHNYRYMARDPDSIIKQCRAALNYVGYIVFDPLPPDKEKEYEDIFNEEKNKSRATAENPKTRWDKYYRITRKLLGEDKKRGLKQRELCEKYDISAQTCDKMLKELGLRNVDQIT